MQFIPNVLPPVTLQSSHRSGPSAFLSLSLEFLTALASVINPCREKIHSHPARPRPAEASSNLPTSCTGLGSHSLSFFIHPSTFLYRPRLFFPPFLSRLPLFQPSVFLRILCLHRSLFCSFFRLMASPSLFIRPKSNMTGFTTAAGRQMGCCFFSLHHEDTLSFPLTVV